MSTKKPSKDKDKQERSHHPWRDNIEAVTVSIVIIVLFKYFVLEAYKIPTGSMQPTLMGWENPKGGGIFDRVLVDKLSYHYRDPERFEVVVFKYPLDRSKNFIKRIVGMPNERLEVRNGDIFHAPAGEELRVLRRPKPVQRATLKKLDTAGEWKPTSGWTIDGGRIHGTTPGGATFPRSNDGVKDQYTDGYPGKMAERLGNHRRNTRNAVGDLRLAGSVSAQADCSEVLLEFREGSRTYALLFPGPAAESDARPSIRMQDASNGADELSVIAEEPWKLGASRRVSFGGQNLDDLVELEIDGKVLLSLEVPPATRQNSSVRLSTRGAGADFRDIDVFRDIYYTSSGQKYTTWDIPDGNYVMLGDNTQDSSDGRDWSLARFELPGEDGAESEIVRGNNRGSENPVFVPGEHGTSTVFFHDELGERRVFPRNRATPLAPERSSFVPRGLIRGRAVLVVWPIVPKLDVYRVKWVR